MVRSLAVILIPLVIITVLFTDLPEDKPVTEVDWHRCSPASPRRAVPGLAPAPARGLARDPGGVGRDRRAFRDGQPSVRNQWALGFLNPDNVFVGLDQGDLQPEDLVEEQTREGTADGQSTVNGQAWERLLSPTAGPGRWSAGNRR